MAFTKLGGNISAINEIKKIEGYLTGFRTITSGKGKKKRTTCVYSFDTKDGLQEVWGSGYIDGKLLEDSDNPESGVRAELMNCRVRLTFKGMGKPKPGENAPKLVDVEVDFGDTKKGGRDYKLDRNKKYGKIKTK